MALEDMTGGTFTISNGGVFGSLMGTPIINPPQSAILGKSLSLSLIFQRLSNGYNSILLVSCFLWSGALDSSAFHLLYAIT